MELKPFWNNVHLMTTFKKWEYKVNQIPLEIPLERIEPGNDASYIDAIFLFISEDKTANLSLILLMHHKAALDCTRLL